MRELKKTGWLPESFFFFPARFFSANHSNVPPPLIDAPCLYIFLIPSNTCWGRTHSNRDHHLFCPIYVFCTTGRIRLGDATFCTLASAVCGCVLLACAALYFRLAYRIAVADNSFKFVEEGDSSADPTISPHFFPTSPPRCVSSMPRT